MTEHFPHTLLNRIQLQQKINHLSASGIPFLFPVISGFGRESQEIPGLNPGMTSGAG
jgi:hypothetical protein